MARDLYPDSENGFRRTTQVYRPLICPFGDLILDIPPGSRILDVGCGSGLFIGLLAATTDFEYAVGFDASRGAINLAKAMCARHPAAGKIEFHHLNVAAAWPDGSFQVVTIIDLFHHLNRDEQKNTFAQAAEKVLPGGIILIKDVGEKPLWRAAFSWLHDFIVSQDLIKIPRDSDLQIWAKETGLELQSRHTNNMLWYGHQTWVFRKK